MKEIKDKWTLVFGIFLISSGIVSFFYVLSLPDIPSDHPKEMKEGKILAGLTLGLSITPFGIKELYTRHKELKSLDDKIGGK